MTQRRKAELLYWQVLGFWKHPESWNRIGYGWKTKPASLKRKSKLQLQALICYLSSMQTTFTTNNYFIMLAVFHFRPKNAPQIYHNNSYSKGATEVEVSIWKTAFHDLTRELSRMHSLQASYFDKCGKVFWPLETGNISSCFPLWPFDLHMGRTKYQVVGPPGTTLEGKSYQNTFCILTDLTDWLLGHLMLLQSASEMHIILNHAILLPPQDLALWHIYTYELCPG